MRYVIVPKLNEDKFLLVSLDTSSSTLGNELDVEIISSTSSIASLEATKLSSTLKLEILSLFIWQTTSLVLQLLCYLQSAADALKTVDGELGKSHSVKSMPS